MTLRFLDRGRAAEAGQILPIFALMIVALLGMAALAIDVSNAYADLRFYRSVADGAALAGAQDLQGASRAVNVAQYPVARQHALDVATAQLQATSAPTCSPAADIVDCPIPGTPFLVSVDADLVDGTCVTCSDDHGVKVSVRDPNYRLTFANVFGHRSWSVGTASVAGITFGNQYAIVTLSPPTHLGGPTYEVRDIRLDGGTTVTVQNGDVGTNANMEIDVSSDMILNSGFYVWHYDAPPDWDVTLPITPAAKPMTGFIQDPDYTFPSFAGSPNAPVFDDYDTPNALGQVPRTNALDPACDAQRDIALLNGYSFLSTVNDDDIWCYKPGIYSNASNNKARIAVATGEVGILTPGAYYLRDGIDVGEYLIGGYDANMPGVAVVLDECNNTACNFNGNNAETIALNAGSAVPWATGGNPAAPAVDFALNEVKTNPGGLVLTLMVHHDVDGAGGPTGTSSCYIPPPPQLPQTPAGCNPNSNKTLSLAGNAYLALAGVQYAPTDNVVIGGGSAAVGTVGQVISWTVKYSGGISITQHYPGNTDGGIMRIDGACSPGVRCL